MDRTFFYRTQYKRTSWIIISAIFFICNILFAQNDLIFERLNTSHGLSNNSVRKIFQDSKGYLWVGTIDGLNKYNGYTFTNFRYDPQDTNSISNSAIWDIFEDRSGNLWIGTEGGLCFYDREKENFKTFRYSTSTEQWENAVLGIFEDSDGKLWLTTVWDGLTHFDPESKQFTHYLPDSTNSRGSTSNTVVWIVEDSKDKNKLWLGLWETGLCSFDLSTREFTKYRNNPKQPASLSDDEIRSLFQDSNGYLWIGTLGGGLNKFNPETNKFSHYKHEPKNSSSISNDKVWSIFEDPEEKGILWIGTEGGLNIFDTETNTFTSYKSDVNDLNTISNDFIWDIYKDQAGVIWIGTLGGLDKYDPGRIPFRHYKNVAEKTDGLNNNEILAMAKSVIDPNVLWIGTYGGGLNRFDRSKNKFTYIRRNPSNTNSLSSDSVRVIFEDPDEAGETMWIGTARGFNKYNLKTKQFKRYYRDEEDPSTISGNLIRQIYETRDGMLWITTSAGLNKFDRKKETFTSYMLQDTTYNRTIQNLLNDLVTNRKPIASILKVGESANLTKPFTLTDKTQILIVSVGEGRNQMFDFGWLEDEAGSTVWKFEFDDSRHAGGGDKNRMQAQTLSLDPGQYELHFISDLGHSYGNWNTQPPINANMWGIQAFKITDNKAKLVAQNLEKFEKPNSIVSSNTTAIIEDSYGMLWIGTNDKGLSKLDRKTEQFTNYSFDKNNEGSISDNSIFSIIEDKSGNLWVATRSGLNKFDPKTNSFKKYTTKDGLPNNLIISILEDNNGNIWLATNNGISKFDPLEESKNGYLTFINYNIQDGLQFNNYYTGSWHKAENGEMFFGGYNGFVSFFPGKSNSLAPRTILSDFRIFNESVIPGDDSPLQRHISETKNITLPYDQNAFSFEFVALHFSQPYKNQYLYKMEGFDKDWLDGHRRYAPYTNLDPGNYAFRVKASNSDGIWNADGVSLALTILPPWWRTVWAYIGYALFFVGLIFGIDRLQRRRLILKTKERMKMQAAEHRAEAAELEARAAKAENERKTQELEEARELQLSMLPKELPQLPNLDIAVYMQTATEVGGDYYDFHVGLDGTLTVVIGDATGHGMKAGTMVTTAKSLFNSYAPNPDILFSFQEITRCIKQMNFGKLSMCLTMLKIKGNKMQISTAGMPPSFIFRKDTKVVEEHLFKAMPLGTMENFPYEIKDTTLKPGDTILLMSDGFPELKNDNDEMYGYKKIRNGFEDIAEKSSEDIITYLKNEGADWVNNDAPDDDVTFVVIKVK